ncbi:MAG: hypothetical protein V4731_13790 [Pseudomonadota bacterium]
MKHLVVSAITVGALAACSSVPLQTGTDFTYYCERSMHFKVSMGEATAALDGSLGRELLYRDAGGQGPAQRVYSNRKLRAELGLGADERDAVLVYAQPPLTLKCQRLR